MLTEPGKSTSENDRRPALATDPTLTRWVRRRSILLCLFRGLGCIVVLAGVVLAVFVLQPFGDRGWAFGSVSAILVGIVWSMRRPIRPEHASPWRVSLLTRKVLVVVLCTWLGLIAWSALTPGGAMPPPKTDASALRVLTWNILLGLDGGAPWNRHGWPVRKAALREAILAVGPDILCVQEALDGQVKFLETALPRHHREGVGRDDGRSGGEACAIFFDADRFERLGGGTFWLEEPADQPPVRLRLGPKRICTWVRLRDRHTGRAVRVYNAHLYLTEQARTRAVAIILSQIRSGAHADEVLLAGDFNGAPSVPSRQRFSRSGLVPTAKSAGDPEDIPTYQFYGIRWRILDEIYASAGLRVVSRRVVDAKPGNTFPSDHFGVLADVTFKR